MTMQPLAHGYQMDGLYSPAYKVTERLLGKCRTYRYQTPMQSQLEKGAGGILDDHIKMRSLIPAT